MSDGIRRVMIDIETLDTLPTAMILSIGAVAFDPENRSDSPDQAFYRLIDVSRAPVGTINPQTVLWWFQQNEIAKSALTKAANADIETVLVDLSDFIHKSDTEVWASPATFDIPILEHAYRQCGLTVPWHYRNIRCWRTLRETLRIAPIKSAIEHHALSDAQAQVAEFRNGWPMLRAMRMPRPLRDVSDIEVNDH
jgi:hypothetical protein